MSLSFRAVPIIACLICYYSPLYADTIEQQSARALQQQNQLERQLSQNSTIDLSISAPHSIFNIHAIESPCISIHQIQLNGANYAKSLLADTLKETQFHSGMCLGIKSIQYIHHRLQHHLIEKGLITSRILLEPQDLNQGLLIFKLIEGHIEQIQFQETGKKLTALGRYATFPTVAGKVLTLSDLEIGLENLRRLSGVEANIQILPSETQENASQILVTREQSRLSHIGVEFNNLGSRVTGKYQGNVNLTLNNFLGLELSNQVQRFLKVNFIRCSPA